jgi:hypothetical protein
MKNRKNAESGIVSIFVTMLLIVIMSLLVMAFAQLSRREQSESLDTQLSTQAFYAAETGVNDAKSAIANFITSKQAGTPLDERKTCDDTAYPELNTNKVLSATYDVSYTCVTIDPTPPYLSVAVGPEAQVLPVKSDDGNDIGSLTFSWTGTTANGSPNMSTCPSAAAGFVPASAYSCPFGGLRLDVVPAASAHRDAMISGDMAAFLMPRSANGSGTVSYAGNTGPVVNAANCSNGSCEVTVTNLNANSYYIRLSRLYLSSNVTVTMQNNRSFKDSLATVDSTGKAQDVLRRIVVSVPLQGTSGTVPNAALISGDSVCKRFLVADGFFANSFAGEFAGAEGNPLCGAGSFGALAAPGGDTIFSRNDPNDPNDTNNKLPTGNGGPYYERTFYNTSPNPDSIVASCVWDWDDGTTSTDSCYNGDPKSHTFPTTATCTTYHIVLTITFNNGSAPKPYKLDNTEPHGTNSGC